MNIRMVALIQAIVALSVGLKRLGVFQGTFALPALTVDSVLDVYLPLVYGTGTLVEKVKLPGEQPVMTLVLSIMAFRVLVQQGRTDPSNFDNLWEGYAPAIGAAAGAAKVLKF